jgi:2-isopropylmalate synthase
MAVQAGATHVQGTVNGYGERCGNANLISVIASLELKLGHETVGAHRLPELTSIARFVSDHANLPMRNDQPFVGKSAFAHKGGVHVSAVMKEATTYEHVKPELIGNRQRVLLSDLSGRGNVKYKLDHYGMAEGLDEEARRRLLESIKEMENQGYDFEVAEGNFELLVLQERYPDKKFFSLVGFDVATKAYGQGKSEAVASIIVNDQGHLRAATGSGQGPFDALHNALRKCLAGHYPGFDRVRLRDYKVRVLNGNKGTAAKVRVLVEWSDDERSWTTVGISHDVIQASARAMLDAIRLELLRAHASGQIVEAPVPEREHAHHDSEIHEAYGWGV